MASHLRPEEARRIFDMLDPLLDVRIQKLLSLGPLVNKDVLDIGFGRGQFLYLLKRFGARPQGLELDPAAIEFARHFGLNSVHQGTLDSRGLLNCIDVVVCNDLIEHPLDPRSLLVAATRSLRPGGHILVWTPNGQAHLRDPNKITFRGDLEHMQYFTPASVADLANYLGLEVVHLETLGFPALDQFSSRKSTSVRFLTKLKSMIRWTLGSQVKTSLSKILKRNHPLISDSRLGCYHLNFNLQKKEL